MPLLEVLMIMTVMIAFLGLLFYILIIGRIGFQFFKYNFPMSRRRGTFYLIRLRNGRFKWVYDRFKSVWEWPDKTKSYIGKKFDRVSQTAEPLIFLVEGYPTNVMLADFLTQEEMSRIVNNILKQIEVASRLENELEKQKPALLDKLLPMLTFVFAAIAALVGLYIAMGISEVGQGIEVITKLANEIQPHIPEIVEALKNAPKQI